VDEGQFATAGHAGGHAHHALLGHAQVEEALGVAGAEAVHLGGPGQVGGQAEHLGALCR